MIALTAFAVAIPAFAPVLAQDATSPSLLGKFDDWEALTFKEGQARVCYMGTRPKKSTGKYSKRGPVFFLVTHRPAESAVGVIEIRTGYAFKKNSEPNVTIGENTYRLFSDGASAFARDAKTDSNLIRSMIRGASMVVKGTSSRGTLTTDTYSLKGFTAAYKVISEACEVSG